MVDNNDALQSNVTIEISLYLRGVYVARKTENFIKLTHSGQTYFESCHAVYYVSSHCVESQMRKLDYMKQFA